jgi:hypothetical protein
VFVGLLLVFGVGIALAWSSCWPPISCGCTLGCYQCIQCCDDNKADCLDCCDQYSGTAREMCQDSCYNDWISCINLCLGSCENCPDPMH